MNTESAVHHNTGPPATADPTYSGGDTQLRLKLSVLQADGLKYQDIAYSGPVRFVDKVKHVLEKKGRFFVTATDGVRTQVTAAVKGKHGSVKWNETLGDFTIDSSSRLALRIFLRRESLRDVQVGTLELSLDSLGQTLPQAFEVAPSEELPANLTQQITLRLAIVLLQTSRPPTSTVQATTSASPATPSLNRIDDVPIPTGNATITPPPATSPSESPWLVDAGRRIGHADSAVENMRSLSEPAATAIGIVGQSPEILDQAGDLYSTWETVVDRMKWVVDITGKIAEIHPYAKMAWSILSFIPRTIQGQIDRDRNIKTLLQAIHDAFDIAQVASALLTMDPKSKQAGILKDMLKHCCDCGDFIQSYARNTGFWKRLLYNVTSCGQVVETIDDYRTALAGLRMQFLDLMNATSGVAVLQVQTDVTKISVQIGRIYSQMEQLSNEVAVVGLDAMIREIPYGLGSRYKRNKRCLPRTREAFIEHIIDWVNDPESTRTLVLFGQAGTGKSSIAHEIACRFDDIGRLTCSYFFVRTERSNDKKDAYKLFTTLARDLSDHFPSFKTALGKAIDANTSLRQGTTDYETLFSSLLLEPLGGLTFVRPTFVVIDALDESGDVASDQGLHKFLADNASKLPSNFRILITSRPEKNIVPAFPTTVSARIIYMNDPVLAAKVGNDVLIYCMENLPERSRSYAEDLAKKAEGVFQWAAVACAYVKNPPSGLEESVYMRRLLDPAPGDKRTNPLDELYLTILGSYFDLDDPDVKKQYQSVMGQFIAAFEPFSIRSLASLRRHVKDVASGGSVYSVVRDLGSLLSNVESAESSLPVVPLHTSFRDFLTDRRRSDVYYVDIREAHRQLALDSLDLMAQILRLNICNLENSHQANKDVEDLSSRVREHIPSSLSYACRSWDDHLLLVSFDDQLFNKLRGLFGSEKLLYWIEALSLLGYTNLASQALANLALWLSKSSASSDLGAFPALVNDALKFVQYFGRPVAHSTPHLYLSALPFAPSGSHVFAQCANAFPNTLSLKRGRVPHWPEHVMAIRSLGGACSSVAFSPDGQHIVSGLYDGTIRVWDAVTGEAVGEPFQGHEGPVSSVTFSPDGRRIASGSSDKTIRVWDAATGEAVGEPFRGHEDQVWSVTFSPDGRRIASGSFDKTIRVWDAATGEAVGEPFRGHESQVWSVTFSPDGRRIASGSDDKTIRVWDAATGEAVGEPFRGHEDVVWSVTFSPDGRRIASGSRDKTIRVWDTATGAVVAGPFRGHSDGISSVATSPDGRCIASGSLDYTVRLWHIEARASTTAVSSTVDNSQPANHGIVTPKAANFSDSSVVDEDGWIRGGDNGELLMWVPQVYRDCLYRPSNVWVVGKHAAQLDLSRFVHGPDWATRLVQKHP